MLKQIWAVGAHVKNSNDYFLGFAANENGVSTTRVQDIFDQYCVHMLNNAST